ncbi:MAG TPA: hypothetical protein PLY97_10330, partial [Acidocella sp.]|nr:hypothetical protein [Acidocella sp.]
MTRTTLSVAVPWSLSHYIPLNGFHPLYRALFENHPADTELHAWDNTELSNMLRGDKALCRELLSAVQREAEGFTAYGTSALAPRYREAFFAPNIALTALLPGDIELHHTAPYPSMTRPFVFHCESFAPIFFPFVQQGGGSFHDADVLREHYQKI